jgi:hypothetical protein
MKKIMDMTVDHNRIVAEWKETKYVVVSSSLFMVPAIYGLYNNLYLLPLVLFIASSISINHWRDATYSWSRIADRIFSKITFATFFYYFIKHSSCNLYFLLQINGLFKVVYYYYMSNKYDDTPIWWKYHIKFHTFCVFSELLIIQNVISHCKRIENIL